MIMTIKMTTTITRQVVKRCPYKDEYDVGELVIRFDGPAPEIHDLVARIGKLTAYPITHEEFTSQVAALVLGAHVVTRWQTAGCDVQCEAGPAE